MPQNTYIVYVLGGYYIKYLNNVVCCVFEKMYKKIVTVMFIFVVYKGIVIFYL